LNKNITELKLIAGKLKRNEEMMKEGRERQKKKVEKLTADLDRKKQRLGEKENAIKRL
jgi:hypothetical protein